jgi:hypothetical protein
MLLNIFLFLLCKKITKFKVLREKQNNSKQIIERKNEIFSVNYITKNQFHADFLYNSITKALIGLYW